MARPGSDGEPSRRLRVSPFRRHVPAPTAGLLDGHQGGGGQGIAVRETIRRCQQRPFSVEDRENVGHPEAVHAPCPPGGGCQTVRAGGRRSRQASGPPLSMTAHGGRCRASGCGTAGWSASGPGAPPRRAARPRLTEGSGQHGAHVDLGRNLVWPATLNLNWWNARVRVAGSSTLGWGTASPVIANTGHLRYRRGQALAHPASGLHLVTPAVLVWKTVYRAAAVEQLNAFFRRSVVRCLGEAWESAWAIEFIPIMAAVATASHARESCAAFQHTSMTSLRTPAFRRG
jgi:hypothetical protein